ncbi:MAG: OmpA family protein [Sphingobacteriaceae bacterium]
MIEILRKTILILLLAFIITGFGVSVHGQSTPDETGFKAAKTAYNDFKYVKAVKALKKVLATDSNHVQAQELLAASYRNLRDYKQALYWYKKLSKQTPLKAEWALRYAETLANNQQYEDAERWYRKYLSMVPTDKRAVAFVKAGISGFPQDKEQWKIAYANINTAASEYAPAYYKGGLIFSSNRYAGGVSKHVFGWDQTPFTDLYVIDRLEDVLTVHPEGSKPSSKGSKGGGYRFNDDDTPATGNDSKVLGSFNPDFLKFSAASSAINDHVYRLNGKVNSQLHEGPVAMLPEDAMLFSRNNFDNGKKGKSTDGINKLKLYTATGSSWNTIAPFPYNNDEYSVGHPTVSKDGSILIIASDMPGGYGGTDLYYSVRSGAGKGWSKPVNLGPKINTEGNEMFPFLYKDDRLFFSSTGHPGFGGLDLFEVLLKDMKPLSSPRNLGTPFNSFGDDFGLIRSEDGMSGFLSSNRLGNDDIYRYEHLAYAVKLSGIMVDAQTQSPIKNSKVILSGIEGAETLYTDEKGRFFKNLDKESDYEFTGKKPGYVSNGVFISTTGIEKDSTLQVVLALSKANTPQEWVIKNCDSLKRVFEVENIYYDLDQSDIREDAIPALNALARLMQKNPKMNIITASHCDSRASVFYNKSLSLRRGEAARNYLIAQGISGDRVTVEYYGKSRLVNNCSDGIPCTEHDQQLNRRTTFHVIVEGVNLSALDCE